MPSGYHHDRWKAGLGSFSQDRYDRLAESLWHWQVQFGAGMTVYRLFHLPAQQTRCQRKRWLHLRADWPWTGT
jgi:uncharacterized protein (UPF0548 family)